MKLFERINAIAEQIAGSQARLAKAIRVPQGTLNGYLSDDGQRKIRLELIESILTAYPQINRNWLYFDEGDMIGQEGVSPALATPDEKDRLITELLLENRELRKRLEEKH